MKHKYALLACARWESPYIAEWLSYYQSIGYDHAYLYCNDDDPSEFYEAISPFTRGKSPFVTYHHGPVQGSQWWMYMHFLQNYKTETEWVSIFDIDEFLAIKGLNDIGKFMSQHPSDIDSIYFNWAFFGNNEFAERPGGSVLRQYNRRQPGLDVHTKHITRTSAIDIKRIRREARGTDRHVFFGHGWNNDTRPHMRRINVIGDDVSNYYDNLATAKLYLDTGTRTIDMYNASVIHHHAFKSANDFMFRFRRGTVGDHGAQQSWKDMLDKGKTGAFLSHINRVEDNYLRDYWRDSFAKEASISMFPASSYPNVSIGKPAIQYPVRGEIVDARNATNGTIGAGCSFHTDHGQSWLQIDLVGHFDIKEIRIYNRIDHSEHLKRASNLNLWVSDDGKSFRHIYRKDDGVPFGGIDGNPLRWIARSSVIARYVRVSPLEPDHLHLNQVEVYGAAASD